METEEFSREFILALKEPSGKAINFIVTANKDMNIYCGNEPVVIDLNKNIDHQKVLRKLLYLLQDNILFPEEINDSLNFFLKESFSGNIHLINLFASEIIKMDSKSKPENIMSAIIENQEVLKEYVLANYYPNVEEQKVLKIISVLNNILKGAVPSIHVSEIAKNLDIKCNIDNVLRLKHMIVVNSTGLLFAMNDFNDSIPGEHMEAFNIFDSKEIAGGAAKYFLRVFEKKKKEKGVT